MSLFKLDKRRVASLLALWYCGAPVLAAPPSPSAPQATSTSASKEAKSTSVGGGKVAATAAATSVAIKSKGWMLEQTDKVSGDRTVYLSPKGIRIVNKQSHTTIVASAPSWRVATFSDSKKVYYECPIDKFDNPLSKPIAVVYGVNLSVIPLSKKSVVTKFGVATNLCESPTKLKSKEFWNTPLSDTGAHRLPSVGTGEYTEALHLPDQETMILLRAYGLPKQSGIPLRFEYLDQDNDLHKFLRTYSMQATDVTDDLFKVPAGYKQVPRVEQVTRVSENDGVENLF